MEPERPIERILRAAASKRRAEPGKTFALHPVDRKALQAEVASVHASKAESAKTAAPGWRSLWPQIGWSFALVLGLAAAVTMMLPRSGPGPQSFRLAKNEVSRTPAALGQSVDSNLITLRSASGSLRGERETDRLQAPLAAGQAKEVESRTAAPSPPEATALKLPEQQRYGLAQAVTPAQPPNASTAPTTVNGPMPDSERLLKAKDATRTDLAAARLADSKVQTTNMVHSSLASAAASNKEDKLADESKQEVAANSVPALTAAAPPAAAPTAQLQGASRAEQPAPVTLRHQFVQVIPSAGITDALAQSMPILYNFELEQTGSSVRITDQDGSVYRGTTQLPPDVNRRFRDRGIGGVATTSAYYFDRVLPAALFTVSGTNITSGQLVTFQGQLLAPPVTALRESVEMKKSDSSSATTGTAATSGLLSTNVQLSGTLTVGTNPPVRVRATPRSRK